MPIQPTQKFSDNHSPEYRAARLKLARELRGKSAGSAGAFHRMALSLVYDDHAAAAVLSSPVVRAQREREQKKNEGPLAAIAHVKEQKRIQRALDAANGNPAAPTMRERIAGIFRAAPAPAPVAVSSAATVARDEARARSNDTKARIVAELDAAVTPEQKAELMFDQLTEQRQHVFDELVAQRNLPGGMAANRAKGLRLRLDDIDAKLAKLAPSNVRSAERELAHANALRPIVAAELAGRLTGGR
jgi:hypothetical protein